MGHEVCAVGIQGVILFPVASAAPAVRAARWLRLQEFDANQSFTTFFAHVRGLLEQLNVKGEVL